MIESKCWNEEIEDLQVKYQIILTLNLKESDGNKLILGDFYLIRVSRNQLNIDQGFFWT